MALDTIIQALSQATGTMPTQTIDSEGLYTAWEVDEEAAFTYTIPSTYAPGTDIILRINEASAGASLNHKWQVVSNLEGDEQTFEFEYAASATAGTHTTRSLTVSASGEIDGTAIAASDTITFTLTRIAASGSEDTNPIKIFSIAVRCEVTSISQDCLGRVGEMISAVRIDFNEAGGKFVSNTQIIGWLNRGVKEAAREEIFKDEFALDVTTGTTEYDLATEIPRHHRVISCRWKDAKLQMVSLKSWERYRYVQENCSSLSTSQGSVLENLRCWIVVDDKLHIWPEPTADETGQLLVYASYVPDDLSCLDNTSPSWPISFDEYLILTAMEYAQKRGYAERWSQSERADNRALRQTILSKLILNSLHQNTDFVPGR